MTDNHLECDAILFDLDGVLIDSSSCIVRHWQEWTGRHGIDLDYVLQNAFGILTIETIRRVAPHLDAEKEAAVFTANEIEDTAGVAAIAGAGQLLAGLPAGAWAVVTSGSLALVKARLAAAGLPIPPVLVTAEDVRQGKPAPEPYLVGAARLGTGPGRCIVIEDAPAGVEAGKRAGMRVIGIASTHPPVELLEKGADPVIEQLANLQVGPAGEENHLVIHWHEQLPREP
jgi:mannitol-1-/sugar-/sorbitol-6-phosphatase